MSEISPSRASLSPVLVRTLFSLRNHGTGSATLRPQTLWDLPRLGRCATYSVVPEPRPTNSLLYPGWSISFKPVMAKVVLGKGLGALINTPRPPTIEAGDRVERIPLAEIVPSPLQPRKAFPADQLQELVESIREHGIIQPLIVRRVNGKCELIAGERRWRAAGQLGLGEAPVIVREASDRDVLEMALIENLQREDLNPIEEAQAYRRLSQEFSMRQEDIAVRVSKSRSLVANSLRLLELHPQIQSYLAQDLLSVGHAKVLLGLENRAEQLAIAEVIIRQSATVRVAEKLVAEQLARRGLIKTGKTGSRPVPAQNSTDHAVAQIENRLRDKLATHVVIHHHDKRGRIEIQYYGNDDLERILSLLGVSSN
jgi:ParB family chromosome partitioning protein